ncbi:hypothetical protein Atai01_41350 [Amycolatopsis taiwanensis]|uniref:Uncharacterized protein n=1 Tax=Amycolatopsis taiwanensis TaxID=342230 RepID=A0A9W6R2E6_9PSEU|nr:hypothetical protein Atai01_41350 [Amycolatopsis taiwanensis]
MAAEARTEEAGEAEAAVPVAVLAVAPSAGPVAALSAGAAAAARSPAGHAAVWVAQGAVPARAEAEAEAAEGCVRLDARVATPALSPTRAQSSAVDSVTSG